MKELNQKIAYLQGLAAGMELADSKEGKLISEILLVMEDMVDHIEVLSEAQSDLEDYVESIDSDLSDLEDDVYEEDDDDDDFDDEDTVEVTCPNCGEEVCFDADILYSDDLIEVTCPECGEVVFINGDDDEDVEIETEDDEIDITPEADKKTTKSKK